MNTGRHSIQVYETRPGFFLKSKKLVASSAFKLKNSDVKINVDRFGQLQIIESRFGRDWNDRGYGRDNDYGYDRSRDRRF